MNITPKVTEEGIAAIKRHGRSEQTLAAAKSHTPGPWTVEGNDIMRHDNRIAQVFDYGVGRVYDGEDCPWHHAKENAKLIAAAPELVKALQDISKLPDNGRGHGDVAVKIARALLAKLES